MMEGSGSGLESQSMISWPGGVFESMGYIPLECIDFLDFDSLGSTLYAGDEFESLDSIPRHLQWI